MKNMLTDRETKHLDAQFKGFFKSLCECFHLSEEEALKEIEVRVNLTKAKMQQNSESITEKW